MKRFGLVFVFALGVLALGATRPSETPLFQMLNGTVSRESNPASGLPFQMADGGGLTMVTLDGGIACNTVATGRVYEMHCDSPGHFCGWPDGGCSASINSLAYGRPFNQSTPAAPVPYYFLTTGSLDTARTQVCAVPASGDTAITCALFLLQ